MESKIYDKSTVVTLDQPSQEEMTLIKSACKGLEQIFRPNYDYKKAGVIALDLTTESVTQFGISFEKETLHAQDLQKAQNLTKAMDHINRRFGNGTLTIASCGLKKEWAVRAESKTPEYTTNWKDLLIVHAK